MIVNGDLIATHILYMIIKIIKMKSLKESLLADIEDTITTGDSDIQKHEKIGTLFTFCDGISSSKASMVFSIRDLKRLTKNLDYINDNIRPEKVVFDGKNKCNMFLNWVEHLTFKELGIDIYKYSDFGSDQFLKDMTKALKDICLKNDIFNSPNKVDIYVLKAKIFNSNRDKDALFEIFISDRTSFSASNMMKFVYKEKK